MEPVITSADGARRNPAAATCTRRTMAWWRRLMGAWGPVVAGGAAVVVARRLPEVAADVRGLLGHGLRLSWLGAAAGFAVAVVAAGAVIQRQLLAAAGARLPGRSVSALVLASTGLAMVPPAHPTGRFPPPGCCIPAGVDDLFDFPELRVRQPGKMLANRANYEIHGAGRPVAIVTETGAHTRLALMSQHLPDTRTLEVTTPGGESVLTLVKRASEWITELRGPAGELIGRIRTGDTRRTYTLLDGWDQSVGQVTGDLALKRFTVTGPAGARFARVRKTWAGPAKEMLTASDHYKVEFIGPVPQLARTLIVMMPILLDLTLYGPV